MGVLNIKTKQLLVIVCCILAFFAFSGYVKAESEWLDSGDITFYSTETIDNSPPVYNGTNYNNCFNTKFTIMDFVKTGLFGGRYEEKDIEVCAYKVPGGLVGDRYFKKDGIKLAGKLRTTSTSVPIVTALPNGRLLEFINNSNYYTIKQKVGAFNNIQISGGYKTTNFSYTLDTTDAKNIVGDDGNTLKITKYGISYSKNAQYLVAESTSHGMVVIDLVNFKVTPFAGFPDNGDISLETSISEDGRYVAVGSYGSNYFKIFDLKSCTGGKCGYLNIHEKLRDLIPGYVNGATNIGFNGNTIWFTALKENSGVVQKYKYAVAPPKAVIEDSKLNYLALGDSFSSGEGVHNYVAYTDTENNKCHLSIYSYPYLLAQTTGNFSDFRSVTCSGAKIKDVMTIELKEYIEQVPQAKGKEPESYNEEIFYNYLPGYRAQLAHVMNTKPTIVTMSMSGNDIGFSGIIKKCVTSPTTCYETNSYGRYALATIINNMYPQLVSMYQSIMQNMKEDGKLYIVGYPQVAKPDGNCAANVNMNHNEAVFATELISLLNSRIEMATRQAGAVFINTEEAFDGHKLCETESWNVAFNGLTAGNDAPLPGWIEDIFGTNGPIGQESYHPNRLGHELFAKAILEQTNNFTKEMPAPVVSDPWVKDKLWIDFVGDTIWPEKALIHYNPDVSADVIFKNAGLEYNVDGQQFSLKPNSEFSFAFYSDPINAGTAASDANGDLAGAIDIPQELPPGYHTLSIKGKNIVNEDIDIQKIVYVADSPQDIDGDGVPNTEEVCLLVEPVGIDADKDGTDDACDSFIDQPPTDEPEDVGVVDNPDITNTNKELPVSEARPQWLLDLESEIQARNLAIAQQNNLSNNAEPTQSATANETPTPPSDNGTQDNTQQDSQNQPQTSSATEVRGIEDTTPLTTTPTMQDDESINLLLAMPFVVLISATIYAFVNKLKNKE